MEALVKTNSNGRNVTTSLIIAEIFGKEHNKVCRDIENLDSPQEFRDANFGVSSYISQQNKELLMYEITKDGFSFLVMGYTGSKAAKLKVDFINEFFLSDDCRNAECQMVKELREKFRQFISVFNFYVFILQTSIH